MIYLAHCKVEITPYMNDSYNENHIELVEAEDECEAGKKVTKFFEDKTDEYAIYYRVLNVEITEMIR